MLTLPMFAQYVDNTQHIAPTKTPNTQSQKTNSTQAKPYYIQSNNPINSYPKPSITPQ